MSCQHHQKELEAAAAGVLNRQSATQFERHLASCNTCRAEFERRKLVYKVLDDRISNRVNEDLPPGFAMRVRARINATREVSPNYAWVAWTSVGAAAAVLIAIVMTLGLWRERQRSTVEQTVRQEAPRPNGRLGMRREESTSDVLGAPKPLVRRGRTSPAWPDITRSGRELAAPQVLVPVGQEEAVARLLKGLRRGEVKGEVLLVVGDQGNQELSITPLSIRPIELEPLQEHQSDPRDSSR